MGTPKKIEISGWEIFREGRKYYAAWEFHGDKYAAESSLEGHGGYVGTLSSLKLHAKSGRIRGFWTKKEALAYALEAQAYTIKEALQEAIKG